MSPQPLDYQTPPPPPGQPSQGPGLRMIALAIIFMTGGILSTAGRMHDAGVLVMIVSGVLFLLEYVMAWNR